MANQELVELLKRSIAAFNESRKSSSANFRGVNLIDANLRDANLRGADLNGANLRDAELRDANLINANLINANLTNADLRDADLRNANLRDANLRDADLSHVDLSGANLSGANLIDANLSNADLSDANLSDANLSGADLIASRFASSHFDPIACDIESLRSVIHDGPSSISHTALLGFELPEVFLRGCGVAEELIIQLPAIRGSIGPISFYSCFISYSHAQSDFAERLHNDLQAKGIRVWLDRKELRAGESMTRHIHQGIKVWDKLILCCSRESLTSDWCTEELTMALQKEKRVHEARKQLPTDDPRKREPAVVVPVDLDGFIKTWDHSLAHRINDRLYADFRNWNTDNAKYVREFDVVLAALREDDAGRQPPPVSKLTY